MKNIMVYICLTACLLFAGCSQDSLDSGNNENDAALKPQFPEEGVSKTFTLPEEIRNSLQYRVYVFRAPKSSLQPTSQDFSCAGKSGKLTFEGFKDYTVNLSHKDLEIYTYKFVTIATPNAKPEIKSLFKPESSKSLADLSLCRTYEGGKPVPLSKDNYWGEGDVTEEALATGRVNMEPERAVGELVFDFGKYEGSSPVALRSSALDRVYSITADVENYTESVMLWNENNVEVKNGTESCNYDLSKYLTGDYKIDTSKAVLNEENRKGGDIVFGTEDTEGEAMQLPAGVTRFYAPYQLLAPADNDLRVTLTFYYHDTYSESGESGEAGGNYVKKTVTLNIPHGEKKLVVVSDAYTRTKVKLRYDRIIDIGSDVDGVKLDPTYDLYYGDVE